MGYNEINVFFLTWSKNQTRSWTKKQGISNENFQNHPPPEKKKKDIKNKVKDRRKVGRDSSTLTE